MPVIVKSIVVESSQVGRIDRIVQDLADCSRSQLRGLFDHRCVRWNGEICFELGKIVQPGDCVALRYDPQQRYRPTKVWRDAAFSLVFEDRDLIVVDKAAHVLSVPTDRGERNTLIDRVAFYLRQRGERGAPLVVHRLDRGVSGLLVFAKTHEAASRLHAQFRDHTPLRSYLAFVQGRLPAAEGVFRSHLATARNLDRFSTSQPGQGEWAVTHYRVIQQLPELTFVEVRLETGRRNQIRIHFAEAGHPILGDPRYGRVIPPNPAWTAKRLALHAATLRFLHPASGETLDFASGLPREMEKFLANAR